MRTWVGATADTRVDKAGACKHWLASVDGVPAGTIRLVTAKGKLTRLAVLKEYRKFGLGRVLVRALEDWVSEHRTEAGGGVVKIHSQVGGRVRGDC